MNLIWEGILSCKFYIRPRRELNIIVEGLSVGTAKTKKYRSHETRQDSISIYYCPIFILGGSKMWLSLSILSRLLKGYLQVRIKFLVSEAKAASDLALIGRKNLWVWNFYVCDFFSFMWGSRCQSQLIKLCPRRALINSDWK